MFIADWREGRSAHDTEQEAERVAARKRREKHLASVVVFEVPDMEGDR